MTEILGSRIGFREVEVKNQAIYINGVPVKFNGVNSHMQHPETGHMVDVETMKKDLVLMKRFNINCVRTCHYPPNVEYIELADELGLDAAAFEACLQDEAMMERVDSDLNDGAPYVRGTPPGGTSSTPRERR